MIHLRSIVELISERRSYGIRGERIHLKIKPKKSFDFLSLCQAWLDAIFRAMAPDAPGGSASEAERDTRGDVRCQACALSCWRHDQQRPFRLIVMPLKKLAASRRTEIRPANFCRHFLVNYRTYGFSQQGRTEQRKAALMGGSNDLSLESISPPDRELSGGSLARQTSSTIRVRKLCFSKCKEQPGKNFKFPLGDCHVSAASVISNFAAKHSDPVGIVFEAHAHVTVRFSEQTLQRAVHFQSPHARFLRIEGVPFRHSNHMVVVGLRCEMRCFAD
jgi:hypothetical protein